MNANQKVQTLMEGKEKLGMDDELYWFLLYAYGGVPDPGYLDDEGFESVMACFDMLGLHRYHRINDQDKHKMRGIAMELLKSELAAQKLTGKDARRIAWDFWGVDAVEWLDLASIGEIIYGLELWRRKNPGRSFMESIESDSTDASETGDAR